MPELIGTSDISLVLLKKGQVFKTVIPTKMLEYMACGRPVILGVDGQARQVLENAKGGIFVEPEDPLALVRAIIHLRQHDDLRETLGRNGQEYVVKNLSREKTAQEYIHVLKKIILEGEHKDQYNTR